MRTVEKMRALFPPILPWQTAGRMVIALLIFGAGAGALAAWEVYPLFDDALVSGGKLRSGEIVQGVGDMRAVGGNRAVLREYAPEKGTWDHVQFYLGSGVRLSEGRPRLEMWVNIVAEDEMPTRIRRTQLLVNDAVGNRNYLPTHTDVYIDDVKQPKGEFIVFDNDPKTWQKLTVDLSTGEPIQAQDRIVRVAVQFSDPAKYYFGGVKLTTGEPPPLKATPVLDEEGLKGLERRAETSGGSRWPWATENAYRVMVKTEAFPGKGVYRPAWAALDFLEWSRQGVFGDLGWSPDSVRVIEYDPVSFAPVRQRAGEGAAAFFVESKVERWPMIALPYDKSEVRRPIYVSWLRGDKGDGSGIYGIYFDAMGQGEKLPSPLAEPSFVGTGDALAYGDDALPLSSARGFPVPFDWDGDGVLDLLGVVHTRPDKGTYLMLNRGTATQERLGNPFVIAPAIIRNAPQVIDINGDGHIDIACQRGYFSDPRKNGLKKWVHIGRNIDFKKALPPHRTENWHYADWDGDGVLDLIVAIDVWDKYGWDQGFDSEGKWKGGDLEGNFYFFKNKGTNQHFDLETTPVLLETVDGKPAKVYGNPTATLFDWDGDGDLDLISGDFLDGIFYFENVGSAVSPKLALPVPLRTTEGPFRAERQANTLVLADWNGDGLMDILVRDEAAFIGILENTGKLADNAPVFKPLRPLLAANTRLNVGQLPAACTFDWDGDGDQDIIFGESGGYLGWFENTGTPQQMRFAAARLFKDKTGQPIRVIAGPNGSIQGPAEGFWGYTVPSAGDWDLDGKPDILLNTVWGLIQVARGTDDSSVLEQPEPVIVDWPEKTGPSPAWNWWKPAPGQWATQWRGTARMIDWTQDGLPDVVAMDTEGYLVLHERTRAADGSLRLGPPQRIFLDANDRPLRINADENGNSGRMKFDFIDWDGDGDLDYVQVTPTFFDKRNVMLFENTGSNLSPRFENRGDMADTVLRSHTCAPALGDFDADGQSDVIIAAEDGNFYGFSRMYLDDKGTLQARRLTPEENPVQSQQ